MATASMRKADSAGKASASNKGKETTRLLLIEVAEDLFGRHGIDGVSLRTIGRDAGSKNSAIIAYYFGTREGLIEAILDFRMTAIEERRSELIRKADAEGNGTDLTTLLHAQWLPVFEQKNRSGKHSFAHFLGNLARSDWIRLRHKMAPRFPVTGEIVARIRNAVNIEDTDLVGIRLQLAGFLVMGSIELIDLYSEDLIDNRLRKRLFNDAVEMAAQSLIAHAPSDTK